MTAHGDAWMPLYIGDYLRDTTRLTRDQHGAYLLLIMDYWVNGAPPDDDQQLALVTRSTPAEWRKLRPVISQFFEIENGHWRHKRIDREVERASSVNQQRRKAGKASAEARRQRRESEIAAGEATESQRTLERTLEHTDQRKSRPSHSSSLRSEETAPQSPPEQDQTPEPSSAACLAFRQPYVDTPEDILFAFEAIREEVFGGPVATAKSGDPKTGRYSAKDLSIAKGWLEDGVPFDPLRNLLEKQMESMAKRRAAPPSTIWFFHKSIEDAAASNWAGYEE